MSRGNINSFTKYAVATPLPHHQAERVANTLVEKVYLPLGIPAETHTDQGSDFESLLFQRVHTLLGVRKTRTTAFHPESNANVERFNRTLGAMLRCFALDAPLDWDLHLPYLVASYNSTPHDSTGLSPNYLMFGRELGQPADLLLNPPDSDPVDIPRYALNLQETLRKAHHYASDHLGKSVASYQQQHDRQVAGKPFSVGDVVWLIHIERRVGHSAKLEQRAVGPYLIISKLGSNYRIAKSQDDPGKVVHYNRLKLCKGSNLVNWLPSESKSKDVGTSVDDLIAQDDPLSHDDGAILAGETDHEIVEQESEDQVLAGETVPKVIPEIPTMKDTNGLVNQDHLQTAPPDKVITQQPKGPRPIPRPRRNTKPPERYSQGQALVRTVVASVTNVAGFLFGAGEQSGQVDVL